MTDPNNNNERQEENSSSEEIKHPDEEAAELVEETLEHKHNKPESGDYPCVF